MRPVVTVLADGAFDGEPTHRTIADHAPNAGSRTLPTQKAEARAACAVINRMTGLGMSIPREIA
ncbi:hypothetical protein [Azospirillum griseum]|uniref:Uncharacterized protein n=1 Tax=Azospirillum griseum TaxID=2496639 RepID=A0A431VIA5_9PROT|nr:hypothetical protein [Azospirillum griseum]RTR21116.1 hypothetical protein EJ903_10315 [Azospirillum griseum]